MTANPQKIIDISGPSRYPHNEKIYGNASTPDPSEEFTKLKIQERALYLSSV